MVVLDSAEEPAAVPVEGWAAEQVVAVVWAAVLVVAADLEAERVAVLVEEPVQVVV